jgi:hypothetical protein
METASSTTPLSTKTSLDKTSSDKTSSDTTKTLPTSSSITDAMSKAKNNIMSKLSSPTTTTTTASTSKLDEAKKTDSKAIEGFDLIGTENSIKRGKASNSIPVYPQSKHSGHIAPYDGGSAYSAF